MKYVITGEQLQKRVQEEMQAVIHCYVKSEAGDDTDFLYTLYKGHRAVLREYLAIQGNNRKEVAMIWNYTIDIAREYLKKH